MGEISSGLSILLATDFDEKVFSTHRLEPILHYGGWVVDRIPYSPEEMIHDINFLGVNVLVVEVEDVPRTIFEACPDLAVVASLRANPVNVDLKAAQKHGVIVLHTPGRNAHSVAELTICLILDLLRHVSNSHIDMQAGNWGEGVDDPYLRFRGKELSGKTVGLVGFGEIGHAVANLLSGFQVQLLAHDPYQEPATFKNYAAVSVELPILLGESDIISIHTPLNDETRDMLGIEELRLTKPGSMIVNTARAAVINRQALLTALENAWISAIALDVHYEEPPRKNDELLALPNVLFTPHIGGATNEVISHGSEIVAADLARLLRGGHPKHAAGL